MGSSAATTAGLSPTSSHASAKRFFSPPLIPRVFLSPTRVSLACVNPNRRSRAVIANSRVSRVAPAPIRNLAAVSRVSYTVSCE